MLETLLRREATGRTLVFTRTKHRARSLAHDLERSGMRVAELQGNMPQSKRQQAIDGFRSGRYDILVATDIAARGIDVTAVKHVINYDAPDTVDAYTHRIGRTGRAQPVPTARGAARRGVGTVRRRGAAAGADQDEAVRLERLAPS